MYTAITGTCNGRVVVHAVELRDQWLSQKPILTPTCTQCAPAKPIECPYKLFRIEGVKKYWCPNKRSTCVGCRVLCKHDRNSAKRDAEPEKK